jgi:hypothetical protein
MEGSSIIIRLNVNGCFCGESIRDVALNPRSARPDLHFFWNIGIVGQKRPSGMTQNILTFRLSCSIWPGFSDLSDAM